MYNGIFTYSTCTLMMIESMVIFTQQPLSWYLEYLTYLELFCTGGMGNKKQQTFNMYHTDVCIYLSIYVCLISIFSFKSGKTFTIHNFNTKESSWLNSVNVDYFISCILYIQYVIYKSYNICCINPLYSKQGIWYALIHFIVNNEFNSGDTYLKFFMGYGNVFDSSDVAL